MESKQEDFEFQTIDRIDDLHPDIMRHFPVFVKNRLASFTELKAFVAASDIEGIRAYCHKQIGVAGSYNCYRLEELALFIQAHAYEQNITPISKVMGTLEIYLRDLQAKYSA